MGLRGPAPTPKAILDARGSYAGADGRREEPIPDPLPTDFIPEFLTEEERETWSDIAPQLINLRVMTNLDWRMLERYCVVYHRWKGLIRTKWAKPSELDQLAKQMITLETNLGMSPAARRSIRPNPVKKEEQKNAIKKYFKSAS